MSRVEGRCFFSEKCVIKICVNGLTRVLVDTNLCTQKVYLFGLCLCICVNVIGVIEFWIFSNGKSPHVSIRGWLFRAHSKPYIIQSCILGLPRLGSIFLTLDTLFKFKKLSESIGLLCHFFHARRMTSPHLVSSSPTLTQQYNEPPFNPFD